MSTRPRQARRVRASELDSGKIRNALTLAFSHFRVEFERQARAPRPEQIPFTEQQHKLLGAIIEAFKEPGVAEALKVTRSIDKWAELSDLSLDQVVSAFNDLEKHLAILRSRGPRADGSPEYTDTAGRSYPLSAGVEATEQGIAFAFALGPAGKWKGASLLAWAIPDTDKRLLKLAGELLGEFAPFVATIDELLKRKPRWSGSQRLLATEYYSIEFNLFKRSWTSGKLIGSAIWLSFLVVYGALAVTDSRRFRGDRRATLRMEADSGHGPSLLFAWKGDRSDPLPYLLSASALTSTKSLSGEANAPRYVFHDLLAAARYRIVAEVRGRSGLHFPVTTPVEVDMPAEARPEFVGQSPASFGCLGFRTSPSVAIAGGKLDIHIHAFGERLDALAFAWSFDDGTSVTSSGATVTHTFKASGARRFQVRVRNRDGDETVCAVGTIRVLPPTPKPPILPLPPSPSGRRTEIEIDGAATVLAGTTDRLFVGVPAPQFAVKATPGVQVFDLRDPFRPVLVGWAATAPDGRMMSPSGLAVAAGRLFVSATNRGVFSFGVDGTGSLEPKDVISDRRGRRSYGPVRVRDGHVVCGMSDGGAEVFRIGAGGDVRPERVFPSLGEPLADIDLVDGTLIRATSTLDQDGALVGRVHADSLNASSPHAVVQLGLARFASMAVAARRVFLISGQLGLTDLAVSPGPTLVPQGGSFEEWQDRFASVSIVGNRLFLGLEDRDLVVLDISESKPCYKGRISTPRTAYTVVRIGATYAIGCNRSVIILDSGSVP